MSVFGEATLALEAAKKATEVADTAFKFAEAEWDKLNELRGTKVDKEQLGKLMDLVKKFAPMALKMTGVGTGGLAIGGLLENSDVLSGLLSKITSIF